MTFFVKMNIFAIFSYGLDSENSYPKVGFRKKSRNVKSYCWPKLKPKVNVLFI